VKSDVLGAYAKVGAWQKTPEREVFMRRWRGISVVVGAIALTFCLTVPAWSTSLFPVNLPEMVGKADRIFVGRAIEEWTGRDANGIPATITTFEITRGLKGELAAAVSVKHLGVTEVQPDGLAAWLEGMPRYRRGTEYLLLLNRDSHLGFTSPVGLFQGAFEVRPAENGRRAVLNGVNNANLLLGLDAEKQARLGLSREDFPFVARGRGLMHLEELVGMIERLQGVR
jgi:hypothetical protein